MEKIIEEPLPNLFFVLYFDIVNPEKSPSGSQLPACEGASEAFQLRRGGLSAPERTDTFDLIIIFVFEKKWTSDFCAKIFVNMKKCNM